MPLFIKGVIAICVALLILAFSFTVSGHFADEYGTTNTTTITTSWNETTLNDTLNNKDTQILQLDDGSGATDITVLGRDILANPDGLYEYLYDASGDSWSNQKIACANVKNFVTGNDISGTLDAHNNNNYEGGMVVATYMNASADPWMAIGGWGAAWACCEVAESTLGNGEDTSVVVLDNGVTGVAFGETAINARIRFTQCTEPCVGCTTEQVDIVNTAGDYPALLYNSNATRWEVFYADVEGGDTILRNARRTGPGAWQLENLGSIGGQSGWTWPGIDAVKSNIADTNTTVACYRNMTGTSLDIVYGERGSWTYETVDDTDTGLYCAITMNASATNETHITYVSRTSGDLKHAWGILGSGTWNVETLNDSTDAEFTDLLIDENNDELYVSYINDAPNDILFGEFDTAIISGTGNNEIGELQHDLINAWNTLPGYVAVIIIILIAAGMVYYLSRPGVR